MKQTRTVIRVGISDLNVVQAPDVIRTSGLGSCVGIVIYDLERKVAGLSHFMLPDSSLSRQKEFNPYKYADTAIPILIKKLITMGANRKDLQAKMAGGAQMFPFFESDMMRIGDRNIEAAKSLLKDLIIPLVAEDVGGDRGRTIEFNPQTGQLMIRIIRQKEFYI